MASFLDTFALSITIVTVLERRLLIIL